MKVPLDASQVAAERMQRHSRLCSCVEEAVGDDTGCDARLTRLANFMEERLDEAASTPGAPLFFLYSSIVFWCF